MCCSKVTKDQAVAIIKRYEQVLAIINKYGKAKEQLLSILLDIQATSGKNYVAEEWAEVVACQLDLPISKVHDVLTFYAMFSIEPRGRYVIEICKSTPCHVTKADAVVAMFETELGIKLGETTPDNEFTLLHTSCVGACDIGPVAKIGEEVYGNLTAAKVAEIVTSYREAKACQK
ncbi:NAD(P)H-dependent oxidoreductase subunit E [Sporomusa sphaeroides DSM 2875]|jgi:NADH-quinone oxidoreductase subunit E|uniref:NADH-quinone oxidoreductase subunit NuoE family protein n=1 Tax=Sporomusa sphaeroides TaxID=47679 RepID=UPI00202FCB1C|nr:NAD(P)H-dependent oxidoreductase subunit E [Sporomusa sphaeroides]MCM0760497.1 NAD(P)H-dependent oxidoreductase subunit E [Sporomusa sphaeroides DSM 2875]